MNRYYECVKCGTTFFARPTKVDGVSGFTKSASECPRCGLSAKQTPPPYSHKDKNAAHGITKE